MLRGRRPNVRRLSRRHNVRRLVAALRYRDIWTDQLGRVYDLGAAVRRDAALALASENGADGVEAGDVDIGHALILSLGDPSDEVRRAAAKALGIRCERRAIPALYELALSAHNSSATASRSAAVRTLEKLAEPDVVRALVNLAITSDREPSPARDLLASVIDRGGHESPMAAVQEASSALRHNDRRVQKRAAEVLTWFGRRSVASLVDVVAHRPSAPAIKALGDLRALEGTGALIPLLSAHDTQVREAAARALGDIADSQAARALAAATADPDYSVREAAIEALRKLAPTPAIADPSAAVSAAAPRSEHRRFLRRHQS